MTYVLVIAHIVGALCSLNALMRSRTPQGTVAWIAILNTLPLLAVPAYWVFGRDRFRGYLTKRRALNRADDPDVARIRDEVAPWHAMDIPQVGERLAELPYLEGNRVDLLIDGEATFRSIFEGIEAAQESILVQFYIVHDDEVGGELARRLIARATAGVRVYFLYDELGSAGLTRRYVRALQEAGVSVSPFHSTRGAANRFQLNFRNHRKIVVVDSKVGWVGGHNVGDEYLGRDPKIGEWRDTHVRIEGPAVAGLMVSFAEDWRWATDDAMLTEVWRPPTQSCGDAGVLILPTGPADRLETTSLMYQQAIQTAQERIWIASPYFVPDLAVMHALHLAALRGVDVRILIPERPDNRLVYSSAFAFLGQLLESGVRVLRYQPGFLHAKTFVVDDLAVGIGTANFDNRSFRLNFEVMALIVSPECLTSVVAMFEADFARSQEMTIADVHNRSFGARLLSQAAYLAAPVQ